MSFKKAIGHFHTITAHRHLVMGYCFRAGLYGQGLMHDLSKYSPTEFRVGAKYYTGTFSPNNAERDEIGVSTSWLHHKGRNRHHFEYWIDYTKDRNEYPYLCGGKMPRRYVAEMVFDRVSACRIYYGEKYSQEMPLEYFLRSKSRAWYIHPETKKQLEFLLAMWADRGEDETVRYIRDVYLKRKRKGTHRASAGAKKRIPTS